jgi:hypothetical protein
MPDKLDTVLSSLRRAADDNRSWPVYPTEGVALIEEIERLRAEVVALQGRLDDYADAAFEAELCEEK